MNHPLAILASVTAGCGAGELVLAVLPPQDLTHASWEFVGAFASAAMPTWALGLIAAGLREILEEMRRR